MVIWLASYPRSGNTFFRILLKHAAGLETHSEHGDKLFDELEISDFIGHMQDSPEIESMDADDKIYIVKTHNLPRDNRPAIYLVRDGRDSLVSHAHYVRSFKGRKFKNKMNELLGISMFDKVLRELIATRPRYGGWGQHVEQWVARSRDNKTVILRYEDLVAAPLEKLSEALSKFNIPVDKNAHIPDFESLHQKSPQFFRSGKSGGWQKDMSPELEELFWSKHKNAMELVGYTR